MFGASRRWWMHFHNDLATVRYRRGPWRCRSEPRLLVP